MNGRYILFAGQDYYPRGGWEDFIQIFTDLPTNDQIHALVKDCGWYHLVDLDACEIYDRQERIWG
jgi:hypothetical protein